MKTALAALVVVLTAPIAVTAIPSEPDYDISDINENCIEAISDDNQATESDEDCSARAVERFKRPTHKITREKLVHTNKALRGYEIGWVGQQRLVIRLERWTCLQPKTHVLHISQL